MYMYMLTYIHTLYMYAVVILCQPGVYTEYKSECIDKY